MYPSAKEKKTRGAMILSVHILRSRKQLPRLVSFPFFSVPCCLLVSFPSLSLLPPSDDGAVDRIC